MMGVEDSNIEFLKLTCYLGGPRLSFEPRLFLKCRVPLSDIFETLITLSILKISSFCKVVLTNQTGTFDNQKNVRRKDITT